MIENQYSIRLSEQFYLRISHSGNDVLQKSFAINFIAKLVNNHINSARIICFQNLFLHQLKQSQCDSEDHLDAFYKEKIPNDKFRLKWQVVYK